MSGYDLLNRRSEQVDEPWLLNQAELQSTSPQDLVGNAAVQEAIAAGNTSDLDTLLGGGNSDAGGALASLVDQEEAPGCQDATEWELEQDALERGEALPGPETPLRVPEEQILPGEAPTTDNAVIYGLGADSESAGADSEPEAVRGPCDTSASNDGYLPDCTDRTGPLAPALVRPGIELNRRQDPETMPIRSRSDIPRYIGDRAHGPMLEHDARLMPDEQRGEIIADRLAAAGLEGQASAVAEPQPEFIPQEQAQPPGVGCLTQEQSDQWRTDLTEAQYDAGEVSGDRAASVEGFRAVRAAASGQDPTEGANLSARNEGVVLGADVFDHTHRHEADTIDNVPICSGLVVGESGQLSDAQRDRIVMETLRRP